MFIQVWYQLGDFSCAPCGLLHTEGQDEEENLYGQDDQVAIYGVFLPAAPLKEHEEGHMAFDEYFELVADAVESFDEIN